jgi:predicted kinase
MYSRLTSYPKYLPYPCSINHFTNPMKPSPLLVLVTGLPCTGKTSLARQVAAGLGFPLIYKDGIKEILFDHLGRSDRAWSKTLSNVTYQIMLHLIEAFVTAGASLLVEANFPAGTWNPQIRMLADRCDFSTFEVLCVTDGPVLLDRFQSRGATGSRHPGHLDQLVICEMEDLVRQGATGRLDLGGGFLQVDTTNFDQLDIEDIITTIQSAILSPTPNYEP